MNKLVAASLVALPVIAASGLYFGHSTASAKTGDKQQQAEAGFICPVTGEELPCEKCCVLNK